MAENSPIESIANTTGATLSTSFTKPSNSTITVYRSGTLAGAEVITLQVKSPAGTYSDLTSYTTGEKIQLTATVDSFDVVGNGTFKLNKSSSASAAGAFYYTFGDS